MDNGREISINNKRGISINTRRKANTLIITSRADSVKHVSEYSIEDHHAKAQTHRFRAYAVQMTLRYLQTQPPRVKLKTEEKWYRPYSETIRVSRRKRNRKPNASMS
jgi:hypothetical protein